MASGVSPESSDVQGPPFRLVRHSVCVRWYLAYGLSLRELKEMMAERGISIDHSTIHRWVVHFSPLLLKGFNRRKCAVSGRWHIDETYIKVRGRWMYLYRAIDSVGDTVEFWFSEHRDLPAAKRSCARRCSVMATPSASSSTAARRIARRSFPVTRKAGCGIGRGGSSSRSASERASTSTTASSRITGASTVVCGLCSVSNLASAIATLGGIEMIHMMRKRQARYAFNPNPLSPSNSKSSPSREAGVVPRVSIARRQFCNGTVQIIAAPSPRAPLPRERLSPRVNSSGLRKGRTRHFLTLPALLRS